MSNYFSEEEKKQSVNEKSIADKNIFEKISLYYNVFKDKIIIYTLERWIFTIVLILIYIFRMIATGGYACLTYCIGIHVLNSFIGFISPLDDPEEIGLQSDESILPQKNDEEFRPFQRKVKEYSFWSMVTVTLFCAIIMTFSEAFDVPVFWPLLLFYFVLIFYLVMKRQIQHMIKYHYLPWDHSKTRYGK